MIIIQHYNNECTEAVDVIRDQRVIYRTAVCDDIWRGIIYDYKKWIVLLLTLKLFSNIEEELS